MGFFTTFDLIIFFGSIFGIMAFGLWAGRKDEDEEDFYLAGRDTRWWGVAGSILGSNVSANHVVGMMGVGFMFGFAQSHFEITAIAGLLMLCYAFLPVYRKLNVFTLSEYLNRRYNDGARFCYAMIMLIIMVIIQMVPGFYIGSRSVNLLLKSEVNAAAKVTTDANGSITDVVLLRAGQGYGSAPTASLPLSDEQKKAGAEAASFTVTMSESGTVASVSIDNPGSGYAADSPGMPIVIEGGATFDAALNPADVDRTYYIIGIILMAIITGAYVIFGGLKAVILTDVIQSVLLLLAGVLVAIVTFKQIGGWGGLMAYEAKEALSAQKMHLYLPPDHPKLPWTGVLTGLMVLHFYYWGTNQFMVQRALAARTQHEARLGIILAGFLKLLIPFFAIATGAAAFYYFRNEGMFVDQDAVFVTLLGKLVAPIGAGLVGLVAAGMIGAILSSLDSMMNSSATIVTFDIYKKYINPNASGKQLVLFGRLCIVVFISLAAFLTIFTFDPNTGNSFFLHVAGYQAKLIPGVVVAFILGMAWKRASGLGAVVAIISGVAFSFLLPIIYAKWIGSPDAFFGPKLNFMHAAFGSAIIALILHVVISLGIKPNPEKAALTWTGLGLLTEKMIKLFIAGILVTSLVFAVLAVLIVKGSITPMIGAIVASIWTLLIIVIPALKSSSGNILSNDKVWAGILSACAIYMMFYFW